VENPEKPLEYAKIKKYLNEKIDWYTVMIDELKRESEFGVLETRSYRMVSLMERINLELSADHALIAKQELNGIMGSSKKLTDTFKDFLVNFSHRLKFYSDTHIRGM
jgi:hypothetical protein